MKELCLDFLNTRWYLTHKFNKEILADPTLLKEFLETRQLYIETILSFEIIKRLLELRAFLANVLVNYMKDHLISLEVIKKINYYLSLSTYKRVVEQGELEFQITMQPLYFDWNWIMAEITNSFVDLIESGDNSRIKICDNPDCNWFFYDETKNRTKRWCDNKCASLIKVRKFRSKHVGSV